MDALAWWRSSSRARRFELVMRVFLYLNQVALSLLAGLGLLPELSLAAVPFGVLLVVHPTLCILLMNAGLNAYLGRRSRPTRLLVATGVLTVAGMSAAVVTYPAQAPGLPDGRADGIVLLLVLAYSTALATTVRARTALAAGALGCAAMYALTTYQQSSSPVGITLGLGVAVVSAVITYRVTLWMLGLVWELERSQQTRADLAVAQERLRFARDLHDVVGSALSVVALKAELAAQLARRGRGEAVGEMQEVSRIARQSLAELRAVVGGYRSTDLDTELAGARSLLASAGICCEVVADDTALPSEIHRVLGWVVREGTTNVLRHSEGRTCTIELQLPAPGSVSLTIVNDGARVDPATDGGRVLFGNGLLGLTERITGLGGTLVAERSGAGHFRLSVALPLASALPTEES